MLKSRLSDYNDAHTFHRTIAIGNTGTTATKIIIVKRKYLKKLLLLLII